MTRIDDAIQVVDDLEWDAVRGGDDPSAHDIVEALDAAGHLLPDSIDDLAVTRVGLALAAQAWSEGRTEGRRQVRADRDGITREHERNPYSAELCKLIKAEEHTNDQ